MNRLILWVYRHPGAIVAGVAAVVLPVSRGAGARSATRRTTSTCSAPRPGSCATITRSNPGSGGSAWSSWSCRWTGGSRPETIAKLKRVEDRIREIRATDPGAIAQVLSLATVLDPDGRLAGLPADRGTRLLADKLDLIAASPQNDLLRGFWNAEAGQCRLLIRLKEQQPAPDKARIFRLATEAAAAEFGPSSYLTGLSFLMTRTTEAVIATQWGTFFWSALGILVMLTLAFRSPVLAVLAIVPTLLAVALVLGLMGWLGIKLDMATALVASVALGLSVDDTFHCLLQFHRHRRTQGFRRRLFDSYRVSGPGVILSSLAVAIGFAALRASEFEPFVNFGTMVGIATAGSTLGNLVLLPACLTLGRRWRPGTKPPREARVPAPVRALVGLGGPGLGPGRRTRSAPVRSPHQHRPER